MWISKETHCLRIFIGSETDNTHQNTRLHGLPNTRARGGPFSKHQPSLKCGVFGGFRIFTKMAICVLTSPAGPNKISSLPNSIQEKNHEAHVPAKQEQTKSIPRLSQADEHRRWPEDPQAPSSQGAASPHGLTQKHSLDMKANILFGQIRRSGIRIYGGPWTLFGAADKRGQIIVALGRTAGPATVRSRARRIARDIYQRNPVSARASIVLMARSGVAEEPRRKMRARLGALMTRLDEAVEKQQAGGGGRVRD